MKTIFGACWIANSVMFATNLMAQFKDQECHVWLALAAFNAAGVWFCGWMIQRQRCH